MGENMADPVGFEPTISGFLRRVLGFNFSHVSLKFREQNYKYFARIENL